jgi:hypothetical protein
MTGYCDRASIPRVRHNENKAGVKRWLSDSTSTDMTHVTQMHQWLKSVWAYLCEFKIFARRLKLWKSAYFLCNVHVHILCMRNTKLTYNRRLHSYFLFYLSCPTCISIAIPSTCFFIHAFTYFAVLSSLGGNLHLPSIFIFCIVCFSLSSEHSKNFVSFVLFLLPLFLASSFPLFPLLLL